MIKQYDGMEEGEITKNKEMYERKGDLRFSQP
jgi:hypothetical protein